MALKLYYHPLSSFCWKALIALYESETVFTPVHVDLSKEAERAMLTKLYPISKFPVLEDEATGQVVPESTGIIEYLAANYTKAKPLVPPDAEQAQAVRAKDRFFDLYIHLNMQKCIGDRMRPADKRDPTGIDHAKAQMLTAYGMIERDMASQSWATGGAFTMADCAALPALFYGAKVVPFTAQHKHTAAYLQRLTERPSVARVLKEAEPFFHMFPKE